MTSDTAAKDRTYYFRAYLTALFPGLLVAVIIGTVSWWLAFSLPRVGGITIAIVLGVLVGNQLANLQRFQPGLKFAEKRILPLAIALLGVELQLTALVNLGLPAVLVILATIATSFFVSIQLGRWLGFSPKMSVLIGAGNGICGSSAVAATGSAIHADEGDIGISISVVNLLGTLGIVVLPAVVRLLSLTSNSGGLLIGGSLQAVGQVVAASFSIDDTVGKVATIVKMGRVLLLGPVVVIIHSLTNRAKTDSRQISAVRVPLFVIGFFALSLAASLNIFSAGTTETINTVSKYLLIVAMAAIGMQIQLRTLFRSGARAFLFGMAVSSAQLLVILLILFLVPPT